MSSKASYMHKTYRQTDTLQLTELFGHRNSRHTVSVLMFVTLQILKQQTSTLH